MFIHCPDCRFLVALDDAGRPPPRCPHCAHSLHEGRTSGKPASQGLPLPTDTTPAVVAADAAIDDPTIAFEPRYDDDHGIDAPLCRVRTGAAGLGGGDTASAADPDFAPVAIAQADSNTQADAAGDTAQDGAPQLPIFARKPESRRHERTRRQRIEIGAAAMLIVLLMLQLVLSQRARLAADPDWRPVITALCSWMGCTVPPWREAGAFRVVERSVRAQRPGVLRVSARIRNDARWAQPWPQLQLTFADVNGRELAARVFQPREYLGGAPAQRLIGNGQTATLTMEIAEPGEQAVAFTFDFH